MKAYTLAQLKFADEMAFPEDMQRVMAAHWPGNDKNEWKCYYLRWYRDYNRCLYTFVLSYSRANLTYELENGVTFGQYFERIIDALIGDYKG